MRQPNGTLKAMSPEELKEYRRQVSRRSYEKRLDEIKAKREANREQAKAYQREYYAANSEWIAEKRRAYHQREDVRRRRKERDARPEIRAKHSAEVCKYIAANREKVYARQKRWKARTGWEHHYHAKKWSCDPAYKLRLTLRNRLQAAIKNKSRSGRAVEMLGCSVEHLIAHLEAQFQPGMNWGNWKHSGWHIDHRIPLAAFDLTDPVQLRLACHYTNLQPMWGIENMRKGAKV